MCLKIQQDIGFYFGDKSTPAGASRQQVDEASRRFLTARMPEQIVSFLEWIVDEL